MRRVNPVEISHARPIDADANAVAAMVRELARFEHLEPPKAVTASSLKEMLAGPEPKLHVLLARAADRPIGYLSYMIQFSAWIASPYVNVDDIYVRAEARGRGVGKRLMLAVGRVAAERDLSLRWEVQADNAAALAFYSNLGATATSKYICRWRPADTA